MIYDQLKEANPRALTLDGFEEAYIGFALQSGEKALATYDYDKCITVLMDREGMTRDDALKYFVYNVAEKYDGAHTPLILVGH
jgi:hypothetical protein